MKEIRTHETISRADKTKMGSEKSFGVVFAVVFGIIGCLPLLHGGGVHLWAFPIALAFLTAAYVRPAVLKPLNKIWFKFGLLLHKIISPVIMALVYAVTMIPAGLIMRVAGKDPLRLKKDASKKSYWIVREPAGPAPDTMKQQF